MRVRFGFVRRLLHEVINEQSWVPGRWYPEDMDETDARMLGDDRGPSGEDPDDDIADHLKDDEDSSVGEAPDETIQEHEMLKKEVQKFFLQEDPSAASGSDPRNAKGAYTSFDMTRDHTGTDDLSSNWYRSPGRAAGTEGDPYRSEDPYSQLGFHAKQGSTSPPGADGEEGIKARRTPDIWQLSAGSDTSKVLGANAHASSGSSDDDGGEGQDDSAADENPDGDESPVEDDGETKEKDKH